MIEARGIEGELLNAKTGHHLRTHLKNLGERLAILPEPEGEAVLVLLDKRHQHYKGAGGRQEELSVLGTVHGDDFVAEETGEKVLGVAANLVVESDLSGLRTHREVVAYCPVDAGEANIRLVWPLRGHWVGQTGVQPHYILVLASQESGVRGLESVLTLLRNIHEGRLVGVFHLLNNLRGLQIEEINLII